MKALIAALAAIALVACNGRPSYWDGDVLVINGRDPRHHQCSVGGTLQSGSGYSGYTTVFGRDGLPMKCRWMTPEERNVP